MRRALLFVAIASLGWLVGFHITGIVLRRQWDRFLESAP